jgi:diadenosine tetraphosphate (Ap4A) HIT family hydrolase
MAYDDDNIFARILRGEIPADKVYEDEHVLAFHDIAHLTPVHVLVVPKGRYADMTEFAAKAGPAETAAIFKAVGAIAEKYDIAADGYRLVSNCGAHGGQEVPHLHFHVMGGRQLGGMRRSS